MGTQSGPGSFLRSTLRPLLEPILRPLRERSRTRRDLAISLATEHVPTTRFDSSDVFVCGYPKSGNTWFQHLVAAAVYGVDPALAPYSVIEELTPDLNRRKYYKRHANPMIFRSHNPPRPEYRNVVHLLRDGRDAMVSYFHHLSALNGGPVDFLRLVSTGEGLRWRWPEHTEAWLANPHGARIMTIRYEDLVSDAARELRRLCDFSGIRRPDALLEKAAAQCSFAAMREKESAAGWGIDDPWPRDRYFVRRGVVGCHNDEMPTEVLAAFLERAAPTLTRCGYLK